MPSRFSTSRPGPIRGNGRLAAAQIAIYLPDEEYHRQSQQSDAGQAKQFCHARITLVRYFHFGLTLVPSGILVMVMRLGISPGLSCSVRSPSLQLTSKWSRIANQADPEKHLPQA